MTAVEGRLIASGLRIGVIVTRFNQFVTDRLLDGALDAFTRHAGKPEDIRVVRVPGAFELPLVAKRMASSGDYDALVALGAVVRGETPHFDYVASAASNGLSKVAVECGVPIGFGVLTTETVEQAVNRAGAKAGNKGAEAMMTAIEMANLLKELSQENS